jgi:hypothetical protein
MKRYHTRFFWLLLVLTTTLTSCKDAWLEHTEPNLPRLEKTLFEQISSDASLSTFTGYLRETGYDKVLSSSKSFTVWAPTNAALAGLDQRIMRDTAALKRFIGNHISNQSYFSTAPKPSLVVRMLNGKNTTFTSSTFEEGKILTADLYLKNGVLHTVDQAVAPKANAWEFLQANPMTGLQRDFIGSLNRVETDTSKGVLLYKDPVTQKGVYQEGTTFQVNRNQYFQQVANISSEDSLMTYIILTDAAFRSEQDKLARFNKNPDARQADTLTKWSVVKDLVVNRVYQLNELPDIMTTVTGVRIHIDKSAIVETRLLSNGIAYVVNTISYQLLENKIPSVLIEGEFPDSVRSTSAPVIRIKADPAGNRFTDAQTGSLTSSPSPLHYFRYRTKVHSATYEVYLRAVNDILAAPVSMDVNFSPRKSIGNLSDAPYQLGYVTIPSILGADKTTPAYSNAFREVYMGTYTAENFGSLYAFLLSSIGASSTAPTLLSIDYIKLKPVN